MRYNTGNPVEPDGSSDARDLYDNGGNFDLALNATSSQWFDRLGRSRKSWAGFEQDVYNFLASSGFELPPLEYVDGSPLTVDRPTQLIERGGNLYSVRLPAEFPVVLSGTWATDETLLVARVDQGLRQELADPSVADNGSSMVGHYDALAPAYLKTVSDMLNDSRVSILRFIPTNLHAGIRDHSNTEDLTPYFADAMAAANPTPDSSHSLSRSIELYAPWGHYLIVGQIAMREGVTLSGDEYGTVIMCGWEDAVFEKIVAYAKAGGVASKNFCIRNLQIAPNYLEDGAAITSPAKLVSLDNVIEAKLSNVRFIQHLQATANPNATNLPITGLYLKRAFSPDIENLTFDGGQYGIHADYASTGGAVNNGRFRNLYLFNQNTAGIRLAGRAANNLFLCPFADIEQGVTGPRAGVVLDGSEVGINHFINLQAQGNFMSNSLIIQNGSNFNQFTGGHLDSASSIGGNGNRFLGVFASPAPADSGVSNHFMGGTAPTTARPGQTVFGTSQRRMNGRHERSVSQTLTPAQADAWVTVAHVLLPQSCAATLTANATADFGGTPRAVRAQWIVSRAAGANVINVNTSAAFDLNASGRMEIQLVNGGTSGQTLIQVRRTATLSTAINLLAGVNFVLEYDPAVDGASGPIALNAGAPV